MVRRRALLSGLAVALVASAGQAQTPAPAADPAPARRLVVDPGLVFAKVEVNGHLGHFLVDTGAPTSVIDTGFAGRARLRLGQAQELGGGGGVVPGRIADNIAIQADGGPALRLDPTVTDLSQIAALLGHALDGILGSDYFARLVLTLDYPAGQATFAEPATIRPPADATRLRIVTTPFLPASARVGGRRLTGAFQIDTGSNTAVSFYTPVARRAFPEVRGQPTPTMGIGGKSRSAIAPLDHFVFAGRTLTNLSADFINDVHPDDAPRDFAGVIGGPAFTGRVLHIDYARALMWLD